jgi:hypothetical protein
LDGARRVRRNEYGRSRPEIRRQHQHGGQDGGGQNIQQDELGAMPAPVAAEIPGGEILLLTEADTAVGRT